MNLPRAIAAIVSGSAVSRLAGFARDALMAALFGAGAIADALVAALIAPNLIRRALADGALNPAFAPLFAKREKENGLAEAQRFSAAVVKAAIPAALAGGLLLYALAGPLSALASGKASEAAAAELLRLMAPAAAFSIALAALSAALNAGQRVGAAALAAALFNPVLAAALAAMLAAGFKPDLASARLFAMAFSAAALLQLAALIAASWPFTRNLAVAKADWRAPELKAFSARLWPGLVVSALPHLALLAGLLALAREGLALAPLFYADRLMQLPLGLISAVTGMALAPKFAAEAAGGPADITESRPAAAVALALTIPAASGLAVLAGPIVSVLFERGAFTAADAAQTAALLQALVFCLPAAALSRVQLAHLWAEGESRRPLWKCLFSLAAGTACALLSFGAATAILIVYALFACGLEIQMRRRGAGFLSRETLAAAGAALASALVMAAALMPLLSAAAPGMAADQPLAARLLVLAALCAAGAAVYALSLAAVRAVAPKLLSQLFSR